MHNRGKPVGKRKLQLLKKLFIYLQKSGIILSHLIGTEYRLQKL